MKRRARRQVALGHHVAVPWMALFVRGVTDYAEEHDGWLVTSTLPPLIDSNPNDLKGRSLTGWSGDGAILAIGSRAEAQAARGLGIPVVNVCGAVRDAGLPRVMVDQEAIGRSAAQHLLDCGLRRLAYCGMAGLWYSQQRYMGFARRAKEARVRCILFEMPDPTSIDMPWQRQMASVGRWLQRLRRPVGIMAVNDSLARAVLGECQRLGINVPHEAALVGSDNDTTVCEIYRPTLTSVSRNSRRVGYEAAALLDRLMMGKEPPAHDILIPPDGLVARQSTDLHEVNDPHVAAATRFMREHLSDVVGVDEVAQHLAISRRQLELRFRRVLGHSPHDYLRRLRLDTARTRLERPDPGKLHTIARFLRILRHRAPSRHISAGNRHDAVRVPPPASIAAEEVAGPVDAASCGVIVSVKEPPSLISSLKGGRNAGRPMVASRDRAFAIRKVEAWP